MDQRIIILLTGVAAITIIDAVGAIASREWKINYSIFSMVSLFIYLAIGYWAGSKYYGITAFAITAFMGLYDAVVGWKIALKLKAELGIYKEMLQWEIEKKTLRFNTVIVLTIISGGLGWIGAWLGG